MSLALWENVGLLGALALVNVLYYAAVISSGGPMADITYRFLSSDQPQLFSAPLEAIPIVAWGTLERVSSLLAHFSWGYLCVKSAYLHKKKFLALALPMGMVDFLVAYVRVLTIPIFECIVFVLGVICLVTSLETTRLHSASKKRRKS